MNTFDLLGFFIINFRVETIYESGWQAAMAWTALMSSSVLALSIIIRVTQEQLAGAKSDQVKAMKDFVIYAILTATFFVFIHLLIGFFNAIYGTLNASDTMSRLGDSLNKVVDYWKRSKFTFSITDLANTFYGAFAFGAFVISYMALVFVVFAMRIAHAILVTTAAFWAAVAIPMSPVNGLDSLKSLKTITMTAFLWPIFDAFFMYLVSSVFVEGLNRAFDGVQAGDVTASELVFVLIVYSIINVFMLAACMAAPFIAQGIANGTGNVTGMLASFGGAGIAAGVMAGKYSMNKANSGAESAWGGIKKANQAGGDKVGMMTGNKTPILGMSTGASGRGDFGADATTPSARKSASSAFDANPSFNNESPQSKATSPGNGENSSPKESGLQKTSAVQKGDSSMEGGGSIKNGKVDSASEKVVQEQGGASADTIEAPQKNPGSDVANQASSSADASQTPVEKKSSGSDLSTQQSESASSGKTGSKVSNPAITSGLMADTEQTDVGTEQASQARSGSVEDGNLSEEQARKDRQARRGAIINKNKGNK